jgi:alpha-galactosidase/6-phospho-beta-glucosidase family protein
MLARWIDVGAGINHQAWFLEFQAGGEDAYPASGKLSTKRRSMKKNRFATRCSCIWTTT